MAKTIEKKSRINSIDIIIVAVLIGLIVVGVKILNRKPIAQSVETRVATAKVEISEVDKDLIDKIQVGDKIFLTVDNVDPAVVVDKTEAIPYEYIGLDQTSNTFKYSSSPSSKYSVIITVEADVKEDDANIYAGGTSLKIGKGIFIKGKGYSSKGFIVELETKAKGE